MLLSNRRSLTLLLPFLWLTLAQRGHPQQDAGRGARVGESVFLDTDNAAIKKLGAARDFLAASQWNDAIELLRQIADQHGDSVVPVSDGRFIGVQRFCDSLLANMGPEGLKQYRTRIDPQARKWFETGRADRNEEQLRKVVQRAFASSFGDDALLLLGDWASERGELSLARNYWQLLVPHERPPAAGDMPTALAYPDTSLDQAAIRARLILCSLLQGNLPRARAEMHDFKQRFPEATGDLAGRSGNLLKILSTAAEEFEKAEPASDSPDISTFAFNPQRTKVLPMAVDVGAVQWQVDLVNFPKRGRGRFPQADSLEQDRSGLSDALWYFPAVFNETVFLSDEASIYAWNLRTGKPQWPVGEATEGAAAPRAEEGPPPVRAPLPPVANAREEYSDDPAARQNAARIFTLASEHHRPWPESTEGIPRFTVTIDQGRLFARLGALPGLVQHTPSLLVCLDVEQGEGKLLWMVEGDKIQQGGEAWTFEGAPLASNGYVYVALRRNKPRPQANVACFEAETGRLVWNRKVCIGLDMGGGLQEISNQLLTLAEDRLYYATNLGAVASLDARDGALRWVQTYRHFDTESVEHFNRNQKYGPNPCLFHEGTVYVAPSDYDQILAFDADTGVQKWSEPNRGEVPALLGANRGKLFVGGDELRALDLETGVQAWPRKGGARHTDPEGRGYGRGLLAENLIYWTTREDLLIVDQQTGAVNRRINLAIPHRQGGGNLAIAQGFLLVARHNRLTAFCDHGVLQKKYTEELVQRPRSPALHYELGCAQQALHLDADAIASYRRACELIGDSDERSLIRLRTQAAQRLFDSHIRIAEAQLAEEHPADAVRTFENALEMAPGPAQRLVALLGLARAEEHNAQPAAAVAAYQRAIEAPDLRPLHPEAIARHQIRGLLQEHGRSIYAAFESRALATFQQARQQDDLAALETAMHDFANSQAAEPQMLEFAENAVSRENFQAANRAYLNLLQNEISPSGRLTSLAGLARVAERRGHWKVAIQRWRAYAADLEAQRVAPDDREVASKILVEERLQGADYRRELAGESGPGIPLVRRWQHNLPDETILIPEGTPPAADLACVLATGVVTRCIDARLGTPRWETTLQERLQWSAFVGDVLILASSFEMCGVTPETGERVWERRFGSASDPLSTAQNSTTQYNTAPYSTVQITAEPSMAAAGNASTDSARIGQSPAPQFVALQDRVVRLSPTGEVTLLYAHDGEQGWSWRSRSGAILPICHIGENWVALQTAEAQRTLVLSTRDGSVQHDISDSIALWTAPPLTIGPDRLAVVANGAEVQAFDLRNGEIAWKDAAPTPLGSAPPNLITNGSALAVVYDGDILAELAPDTGRRLWSKRIGSHSVREARRLAHLDGQAIYAASGGVLRSFALGTGKRNWEQYLGDSRQDWKAMSWGNQVWAWPTQSTTRSTVVVCDAVSGELLERFPLELTAESIMLWPSREFTLVAAGKHVSGLETLAAR